MKNSNVNSEDSASGQQSSVKPVYRPQEDETHQERMRRLHNARASQRAARDHRRDR